MPWFCIKLILYYKKILHNFTVETSRDVCLWFVDVRFCGTDSFCLLSLIIPSVHPPPFHLLFLLSPLGFIPPSSPGVTSHSVKFQPLKQNVGFFFLSWKNTSNNEASHARPSLAFPFSPLIISTKAWMHMCMLPSHVCVTRLYGCQIYCFQ